MSIVTPANGVIVVALPAAVPLAVGGPVAIPVVDCFATLKKKILN